VSSLFIFNLTIIFVDGCGKLAYIDPIKSEGDYMTKVRVGDNFTVKIDGLDQTVGKVYTVAEVEESGFRFRDDAGDMAWMSNTWEGDDWNLAPASTELEELRAFKAQALTRFPALAEPETDSDAAQRFAVAIEQEGYGEGVNDILLEAFVWARANPR
jgi:hypothetical protein